jgi:hypothetical protein
LLLARLLAAALLLTALLLATLLLATLLLLARTLVRILILVWILIHLWSPPNVIWLLWLEDSLRGLPADTITFPERHPFHLYR